VIVGSEAELSELIPVAEEIQRKEMEILERMNAGASLLDMLNFDEHFESVRAGKNSRLTFLL
jgi:hypothetical protein